MGGEAAQENKPEEKESPADGYTPTREAREEKVNTCFDDTPDNVVVLL
ncbi:MAG: hypothetical protein KF749_11315 [Bacteroidetes bacterium]|nr:hypothetical protein [Bacteroidota bacterium]MCW5897064.1 hypothetical protein [Bacteroidota bacterium]